MDAPAHPSPSRDPLDSVHYPGNLAPTSVAGAVVFYGFWIVVSLATGRDMPTLRWSIPFVLISLTIFVVSVLTFSCLQWLEKKLGESRVLTIIEGFVVFLLGIPSFLCAFVGFLITVVAFVDVPAMAALLYGA